jgi:hypothetical protein
MSTPRWKCPACGSTDVHIALPAWHREDIGDNGEVCEPEYIESDTEAQVLWWVCNADNCYETGQGAPVDLLKGTQS